MKPITYPCKHGVAEYCGVCEVVEPMERRKYARWEPLELQEPIDFEALSEAYKKERWNWWNCGIPSPGRIREKIENDKLTISETNYVSSGGITLKRELGKFRIFIAGKLARHILKNQPMPFCYEI